MNLLSGPMVKLLLYAIGALALLCVVEGAALYVQAVRHREAATTAKAESDQWRNSYATAATKASELVVANAGWKSTAGELQAQLVAEQKQCAALTARNDKAIATARAEAADADAALKTFVDRFAAAQRKPDCASALHALAASCPSLEGY
ncbi:hypothetical protein EA658_13700 [Pseudoxanthomonas winnipegensis]|uniref:DUF2514 family protein n=1 Tax=Pseudoxanthomonas winnipegensis TaxID=2480810 RepID=A0ABY1WB15_9GAMM|nr:hypothetical protein [Pseudoxanthomonas winnipegensis]TAA18201.1 hypothetical protein EA658_13700 [Pseudoxanthomonas winnipegensis]